MRKALPRTLFASAILLGTLASIARGGPDKPARPEVPSSKTSSRRGAINLVARLVDSAGKPVAGAVMAEYAGGDSADKQKWNFYTPFALSNDAGEATLWLKPEVTSPLVLYVLHQDRKLVAFHEVTDADGDGPVTVTLVPACRVTGRLVSADFEKLKRPIDWTNVYLFRGTHRSLNFMSKRQEFEFYLPPGKYELEAYGTRLAQTLRTIEVKPGQSELSIGNFDLPADALVKLFGKPAPEFQKIKGWKNGPPVTLAQLRGKVVLLDFWGFWCGPCVAGMHDWMTLHDDFAELGVVVIGVHDDSVADLAELDRKLQPVREHQWWGRDVPFLEALDGGGETKIAGSDMTARGATTAAYGITGFPTGLLIDRDGTLVGDFWPNAESSMNQLRQLCGLKTSPDPFALTHKPTWRKRFDSQYLLGSGDVLKYFPESFQERAQYVTSQLNRFGGVGEFPKRITVFLKDRTLPSDAYAKDGDPTLGSLLRSLAPYESPPDLYDCPQQLAQMKIPGDWMVRESSSLEERLKALGKILDTRLGKKIRFEPGKVERQTVVVSGFYKFHPLPGAIDQNINVTTDLADLQSQGGGGSGTIGDLLTWLSHSFGRPFIGEVRTEPNLKVMWWQRESAYDVSRNDKKLEAALAILAKQTSLKFEISRRSVDVWHVREQGRREK